MQMETGTQSRVPTRQDYGQVLGASTQCHVQDQAAKAGQGINAIKGAGQGLKPSFKLVLISSHQDVW